MPRLSLILSICSTALVLGLVASGCGGGEDETAQVQETPSEQEVAEVKEVVLAEEEEVAALSLEVSSPVLPEGEYIPDRHTCERNRGKNASPPLHWSGVPEGTKSIALTFDDPDALGPTFVHWVIYGIPPDVTALEDGVPTTEVLPNGARQGVNDFGNLGYGGPCPRPAGRPHNYAFKVYALDTELDLGPGATKEELLSAMAGHRLAEGELSRKARSSSLGD